MVATQTRNMIEHPRLDSGFLENDDSDNGFWKSEDSKTLWWNFELNKFISELLGPGISKCLDLYRLLRP